MYAVVYPEYCSWPVYPLIRALQRGSPPAANVGTEPIVPPQGTEPIVPTNFKPAKRYFHKNGFWHTVIEFRLASDRI